MEISVRVTWSSNCCDIGIHIEMPRQATVLISTFPTVLVLTTPISAPSCLGAACHNSCLIPSISDLQAMHFIPSCHSAILQHQRSVLGRDGHRTGVVDDNYPYLSYNVSASDARKQGRCVIVDGKVLAVRCLVVIVVRGHRGKMRLIMGTVDRQPAEKSAAVKNKPR